MRGVVDFQLGAAGHHHAVRQVRFVQQFKQAVTAYFDEPLLGDCVGGGSLQGALGDKVSDLCSRRGV